METEKYKKAKLKIASYCAYQERCQQEVRTKLYSYELYRDEVDELIAWLITENYVNEERFAITFAGGKFRIKKWGKFKITQALKQKAISDYCIKKAIQEIDLEDYLVTINELATKKLNEYSVRVSNEYHLKNKTAKYIISKGFEPDLVWEALKNVSY
ncbi:MAG: RecX family transcriptional regulator [Cyclobacteriaceae bacterium]|nr:RecX family transcriptional regulator [Cyclobacteriaceae bacterium]